MKVLKKAYIALTKFETWFIFIVFFFATVATVINVILRKYFGLSFNWIDELSRFILIITVCLGMSLAVSEGSHPKMDSIQNIFKGKQRLIIILIADLILAAIMIWGSRLAIEQELKTIRNGASTSTLPLKLWVFYMFVPLGFTGGAIRSLFVVYFDLLGFWNKDPRAKAKVSGGEEAMV